MVSTLTWGNISGAVTLLSTELNALAAGAGSAYGPEINNVLGPQRAQLWLHLASNSLALTSASYVTVYIVKSTTPNAPGGAYPTYTPGTTPKYSGNGWACTINLNPQTQSANVVDEMQDGIVFPAGYSKTLLVSSLGGSLAFPATGNTLIAYGEPTQSS